MSENFDLNKYGKKRKEKKTPEPKGKKKKSKGDPVFVIQKHDASQLHYDLRLEIGGVLKSWAVPKGPSTKTGEKRLAAPTENHPLDYADFEGVIPEEEYGGGTVMIWDKGTFKNLRKEKQDDGLSLKESYEDGKVEIWLEGEKLKGGYALIKTERDNNWLLIKMDDEASDGRRNPVSTEPESVKTGRRLKDIEKEEKNDREG